MHVLDSETDPTVLKGRIRSVHLDIELDHVGPVEQSIAHRGNSVLPHIRAAEHTHHFCFIFSNVSDT